MTTFCRINKQIPISILYNKNICEINKILIMETLWIERVDKKTIEQITIILYILN